MCRGGGLVGWLVWGEVSLDSDWMEADRATRGRKRRSTGRGVASGRGRGSARGWESPVMVRVDGGWCKGVLEQGFTEFIT